MGRRIHVIGGGGYMSYEEEDTCHMRRRIHVYTHTSVAASQEHAASFALGREGGGNQGGGCSLKEGNFTPAALCIARALLVGRLRRRIHVI
jgi:hypothetical protein